VLQIECPDLAMVRHLAFPPDLVSTRSSLAAATVDALNHALRDSIPPCSAFACHMCSGQLRRPHHADIPLPRESWPFRAQGPSASRSSYRVRQTRFMSQYLCR